MSLLHAFAEILSTRRARHRRDHKRRRPSRLRTSRCELLEDRRLLAAVFSEFLDPNPNEGNQFGDTVVALSTGNVVITSPFDDAGGTDAGAVYLFNGATGALISTLTGGSDGDQIGSGGVTELATGNFLVRSPFWDNGAAADAGAVTFGNGVSGVSGEVNALNSLIGGSDNDGVGQITVLPNGNYVVASPNWDSGGIANVGAVTFGNGLAGVTGSISTSNSLIGTAAGDLIGFTGVTVLANGNYVVSSRSWNNGAGAVTFGSGVHGVTGAVAATNSLVGSSMSDAVGEVQALKNGNYVVISDRWDRAGVVDAGAVTFGDGEVGVTGAVSELNSLVGSSEEDRVGAAGVVELTNGNYVVATPLWDSPPHINSGAVTFADGTTGISGEISSTNSLVSGGNNQFVGGDVYAVFDIFFTPGVVALSNGNYVVISWQWNANRGAVTFGDGVFGTTGFVNPLNSLVGSTIGDEVGSGGVVPLANGNYVVGSPSWEHNGVSEAGAVTLGDGVNGIQGAVNPGNSLVGSSIADRVGRQLGDHLVPLNNGNFVVVSPTWDKGLVIDAGAVTFSSGQNAVVGPITAANSLVGGTAHDIGYVQELSTGNYVVVSQSWDNGPNADAGAVTFGNGTTGVGGEISSANSLVGSSANDRVGANGIVEIANGNYVVTSQFWNDSRGAFTFADGTNGITGVVSMSNSLVGSTPGDGVDAQVTALSDGDYVVSAPRRDRDGVVDAGAMTFANGNTGATGAISETNSLVGSSAGDVVGTAVPLDNGNYLAFSPLWDNRSATDAGAVTFGSGTTGVIGKIGASNSAVGLASNAGLILPIIEDEVNGNFYVRFIDEFNGKVRVGSLVDGVETGGAAISGTIANQTVDDNATIAPFSGVTIDDNDDSLTITVTLSDAANGTLSGGGFADLGGGVHQLVGVTPAAATTAIRALTFTPTVNQVTPGETVTTIFEVSAADAIGANTNGLTSVVATSLDDLPVANDDPDYSTNLDTPLVVSAGDGVLANDVEPDVGQDLEVISNTNSAGGATVAVNADGSFTYDPSSLVGPIESDTFTYTIANVRQQPTPGADFFVDAGQDIDGDDRWEDLVGTSGFELLLDDDPAVTRLEGVSALPGITAAYDFAGGAVGNEAGAELVDATPTAMTRSFQEASGDWTKEDVTVEIWFKPDNLDPATTNGQVLFEDGGARGLGFYVDDNQLRFRNAPGGGNVAFDISAISDEFIQAVGALDLSTGRMDLYVNGAFVGFDIASGSDWSGGDGSAVGTRGEANTGGIGGGQAGVESFDGQIALLRIYHDQLLTEDQVEDNFQAVASPRPADTATVTVSLSGSNSPPTVSGPVTAVTNEDAVPFSLNLLTGAVDPDSDPLNVSGLTLTGGDASGVTVLGNSLSIEPSAYNHLADGETEVLEYSYSIEDGAGGGVTQSAVITILGLNDAPDAMDDAASALEDGPAVSIDLTGNDVDPDSSDDLEIQSINTAGTLGRVTINVDNDSVTYDPAGAFESLAANETATDQFAYVATDGKGGSDSAIVTITVAGQNDAPTVAGALPDLIVPEDSSDALIDLSSVFDDVDASDMLTYSVSVDNASLVAATMEGTNLRLAFQADQNGLAQITVTATDPSGAAASTAFNLTVQSARDQIQEIIAYFQGLVDEGTLNVGEGNAFISKLENAVSQLDQENEQAAINLLNAVVNHVNAFLDSGGLPDEDGEYLLTALEQAIASAEVSTTVVDAVFAEFAEESIDESLSGA